MTSGPRRFGILISGNSDGDDPGVHDALSRLVQATNPESGTVSYAYDNAENLVTRSSGASRHQTGRLWRDCVVFSLSIAGGQKNGGLDGWSILSRWASQKQRGQRIKFSIRLRLSWQAAVWPG